MRQSIMLQSDKMTPSFTQQHKAEKHENSHLRCALFLLDTHFRVLPFLRSKRN
jgi:hypothetical protein